jgi:hypothetical protein
LTNDGLTNEQNYCITRCFRDEINGLKRGGRGERERQTDSRSDTKKNTSLYYALKLKFSLTTFYKKNNK